MGIDPAKTKGTDPCTTGQALARTVQQRAPRLMPIKQAERRSGKLDCRVYGSAWGIGDQYLVPQFHQQFDQPRHSGRHLAVANPAFDTGKRDLALGGFAAAMPCQGRLEAAFQTLDLDRVANTGACAMGLDGRQTGRVQPGLPQDIGNQPCLRVCVRGEQRYAATAVIDTRGADHTKNG